MTALEILKEMLHEQMRRGLNAPETAQRIDAQKAAVILREVIKRIETELKK